MPSTGLVGGHAPLRVEPLPGLPPDADVLARRLGRLGTPCRLDWSAVEDGWAYVVPPGRRLRLHEPTGADPLERLGRLCDRLGLDPGADRPDPDLPPFTGGVVTAVGYDLARHVERIPAAATSDRPAAVLDVTPAPLVVAVHRDRGEVLLLCRGRLPRSDWVPDDVVDALQTPAPDVEAASPAPQRVATSLGPAAYRAAVARALEHIAAGDTFQVNVTQRLTARWPGSATALYDALRHRSPAPHAALVPTGAGTLASISPETFLRVRGRAVSTRPIKGTRPRSGDADTDRRLAARLRASAKDRAENVMIVDLLRNDLGRVCEPGSVTVPALAELEAHPTVWHLVSTVAGRLRPDLGYADLLRATFPCGSVTGAPKVRAMELIEDLEPVRRGWYCGAIGYLAPGAAHLSVAIRTAVLGSGGRVDYGAGGGVVADSNPSAEHAESLDKAAPFLTAVRASAVGTGP